MHKIDKNRLPNIEYKKDGKDFSAKFEGGKMPLEQVLSNTDKSIFLIADGGVGKSTTLRALWLDSLCNKDDKEQDKKRKSYIYVDLKLLDDKENYPKGNSIYRYINNYYNINMRVCKPDNETELILLLDGANEASGKLREENGQGKCELVQYIEEILNNKFRVVISSRSRDITMQKPNENEHREERLNFDEDKMLYCKLGLLGDEIIKKEAPNVREDSALYKLLKNNMMLYLYRHVKEFIEIDQDKITAGKLLDLYFEICFKTRYVKNVLNIQDNEKILYNKITNIERIIAKEPKKRIQEHQIIIEALLKFKEIYDYLVDNSQKNMFTTDQLINDIWLSDLEHMSILQQSGDSAYVWANEGYQEYFEAQKYVEAIKILLEEKGGSCDTLINKIKRVDFYSWHFYNVIQYAGEIAEINQDKIELLYKKISGSGCERFVNVMSVLTGNFLPEGIKIIGKNEFMGCQNLIHIVIPNSVESIGNAAFADCTNLERVTIGRDVKSIGVAAFWGCNALSSVYYNGNIDNWCHINFARDDANPVSYAHNLYIYGQLVTELTVPDSVRSICYSFTGCTCLRKITISNSVKKIGDSTFANCNSLIEIILPNNSITSIGGSAFSQCCNLNNIVIPNSVMHIGEYAFSGCSSLERIEVDKDNNFFSSVDNCLIETKSKTCILGCKNSIIPIDGSVTSIGNYAFMGCNNLEYINLPFGLTSIGDEAFADCSKLETVCIPNSIEYIGYWAFSNCFNLKKVSIENGVKIIYDGAFRHCVKLESVIIPDSVGRIGVGVFNGCTNLSSLILPKSVKVLDDSLPF